MPILPIAVKVIKIAPTVVSVLGTIFGKKKKAPVKPPAPPVQVPASKKSPALIWFVVAGAGVLFLVVLFILIITKAGK